MQAQTMRGRPAALPTHQHRMVAIAGAHMPMRPHIVARAADAKLAGTNSSEFADQAQQGEGGKCPFLAALPSPPSSQAPWYKRLNQLFSPAQYAKEALGSHEIVSAPPAMGMPGQFILGRTDHVKAVFSGEADGTITTGMMGLSGSRRLLGTTNLVVVPEPRHSYLRKLIMPSFSNESIEKMTPRMEAVLSKYLDKWADAGSSIKAHDQLRKMTFEFIIAIVMGKDYPEETITTLGSNYTAWVKGLLAWPFIDLPFTTFGKALAAHQDLLAFFQDAVDEARAELAAGRQVPGILGSLVAAVDDDGNRLTDTELKDNLMLLMLAGHDTSSTTLTNTMANLQNNRHVLDKLREEQRALIARHGPAIDGPLLKEMTYADAVIRETLRLNNVVSGLMRTAAKDFELGGYLVPKGTPLLLPLTHLALTDPRWVDDAPAEFRPERMLTPEGMKPGAQMPFGHGPRFCAGYAVAMAEMKVFLALLARSYDFDADTNTQWVQEIGKVPKNGLPMTVTRV